ncbi:hypothetical protein [Kineothrix alysoides]|nr:hypothetical protein [Kineothrix alysoides]
MRVDHVKAVTASYNAYGTAEGPKGDFDATLSAVTKVFSMLLRTR